MEKSKFYQIKNITEHEYVLVGCDGSVITRPIQDVDKSASVFTIQDAKAGDVLVIQETDFTYESIFIFNKIENNHIIQYLHYFITDKGEEVCDVKSVGGFIGDVGDNVHPATKEQRDTLMKAMADAGYAFDFDKKELKKIEQKPAWSEEDEKMLQGIWDEIIANKHDAKEYEWKTYDKFLDWLKSLKQRCIWKPSDEQLDALQYVYRNLNPPLSDKLGWNSLKTLELMYHDLKKLK